MKAEPESRFGAPSARCPHPEWWSSTDDHSTEVEVSELLAGLVRALQPDYCVETGSAWGQTSEMIGQALQANEHGLLVSLETDPERVEFARDRIQGLPVTVLEQSSMEYTPAAEIQFAFFDSLFPLRIPEFRRYRPWMRAGTIVAFHDTAPQAGGGQIERYDDLRQEVESEPGLRILHLPTPRGITIGEVL